MGPLVVTDRNTSQSEVSKKGNQLTEKARWTAGYLRYSHTASAICLHPTHRCTWLFVALILKRDVHSDASHGHQQPASIVSIVMLREEKVSFLVIQAKVQTERRGILARPGCDHLEPRGYMLATPKSYGLNVGTSDLTQERKEYVTRRDAGQ